MRVRDKERGVNEESEARVRVMKALGELFDRFDTNKNGQVTPAELNRALRSDDAFDCLRGVDYTADQMNELTQLSQVVLKQMHRRDDMAGSDAEFGLNVAEFIDLALRIRGPAASRDLLSVFFLVKDVEWGQQELTQKVESHQEQLDSLTEKIDEVLRLQRMIVHGKTFQATDEGGSRAPEEADETPAAPPNLPPPAEPRPPGDCGPETVRGSGADFAPVVPNSGWGLPGQT
eukprot:CAMPEP_0204303444 /NCGR_PEP_ID=MMETSP0468-20130131/83906_1 /ASSEMBLY_ACC=CAM_ASM_000383 /TAXON_ID=2969 /ORGANISM="Oxyrrhis marina" /LENGTH=231 /DNA_ID=CAMNT_0051282753 /DNA_START=7 /DNA_END=702 /DNA_ORIENTATION=+